MRLVSWYLASFLPLAMLAPYQIAGTVARSALAECDAPEARYEERIANCRSAADQRSPVAQCILGLLYLEGRGVPQSLEKAASSFRKATDQRVVEAQFNLGVLHLHGRGVVKSLDMALHWFREAANRGAARPI